MFTDNLKKTIFDDIHSKKLVKATIPEDEVIETNKKFSINKDRFDSSIIVDDFKIPSFKYLSDNSLNDFYEYPDITLSQNPEYKYKYPKLSNEEYFSQQWQTEEGVPNQLNQFIRQDQTSESIEDIKEVDDAYQSGLKLIHKMIDEETEAIKKVYKDNKSNDIDTVRYLHKTHPDKRPAMEKVLKQYEKKNPVLIAPVFTKPKGKEKEVQTPKGKSNGRTVLAKAPEPKKSAPRISQEERDSLDRLYEESQKKKKEKEAMNQATLVKTPVKAISPNIAELKKNFEKNAEQPTSPPPSKSIEKAKEVPPMKASDEDSDDETINNDKYNPLSDKIQKYYDKEHTILSSPLMAIKEDNYNMFQKSYTKYKELNILIDKIQNKKKGTSDYRTLKTIRRELHLNSNDESRTTPKK